MSPKKIDNVKATFVHPIDSSTIAELTTDGGHPDVARFKTTTGMRGILSLGEANPGGRAKQVGSP